MTLQRSLPIAVLLLASALPAAAQPVPAPPLCGERDRIVAHLSAKYGELAQSLGFSRVQGVVEIYANPESGSWTILVTDKAGRTCAVAAGEAFHRLDPAPAEAGESPA